MMNFGNGPAKLVSSDNDHSGDPSRAAGDPLRAAGDSSRTSGASGRRISREDLQDLAKIGGDLLKRTVASSFEAFKEVREGLPKEASNLLSRSKDDLLRGLSREAAQSFLSFPLDKFFSILSEYKIELSVSLKKSENGGRATPQAEVRVKRNAAPAKKSRTSARPTARAAVRATTRKRSR